MRRIASLLLIAATVPLVLPHRQLSAQFRAPRSADYLFVALDNDARMLWVNPAALGIEFQASLMGEVLIERNTTDGFPLAQYTLGFSSRGVAFGYRRDRFDNSTGGNTFRFGFGRRFRRYAVGGSATLYSDSVNQREGEIGIRYFLLRGLDIGAVIQHIGKPTVRGVRLPLTGVLGVSWSPLGGAVQLVGEAAAADRATVSGYDLSYRAGVRVGMSGTLPFGIIAALDLDEDFGTNSLVLGLQVGRKDRGVLVGNGARPLGSTVVNGVSLVGIASRPLRAR